jgi:DNA-binding MarR family transcriptional regulator
MAEAEARVGTFEDAVLVSAMRAFVGISVRAADQMGPVSLVQLRALTVLEGVDGANLLQFSERMGVTVSTASRLVDRLVGAGLVDRRPSQLTRREISLRLTPRARDLLSRYHDLRLQVLRQRLDQLPPQRRSEVIEALADLLATEVATPTQ